MFGRSGVFSSFYMLFVYAFLYIPIIILVAFSFNKSSFPFVWSGFSWQWYHQLWYQSDQLWAALYNSLFIAVNATILSLCMGMALVFYSIQSGRLKSIIPVFYANLVVPELVIAVGLLSFFSLLSIPLGKVTLIIAHSILGIGYSVPILYTRYQELDYRLIEASLDLGASFNQTFFKIVVPLLKPAIMAGGLLVFIISFDDFVLSYFCAGTTAQTLPIYILSMLRTGISPVVNALSTGLLLVSSLLVLIFCSLAMRMRIF